MSSFHNTNMDQATSFQEFVSDVYQHNLTMQHKKLSDKPFAGAQPHFRRQPEVRSEAECAKRTKVVIKMLIEELEAASGDGGKGVQIMLGDIALNEKSESCWKDLLVTEQITDAPGCDRHAVQVALGDNITHQMPRDHFPYEELTAKEFESLDSEGTKFTLLLGQPSNYMCMATNSQFPEILQDCFDNQSLAVITSTNSCLLPVGTQVESVVGIDSAAVVNAVRQYLAEAGCQVGWSHGAGTKRRLLSWIMPSLHQGTAGSSSSGGAEKLGTTTMPLPLPTPLAADDFDHATADELERNFKHFDTYFTYLNHLQAARPGQVTRNYFDVGLTVSLVSAHAARSGVGLLIDADNVSTQNEGSIGHTMTKMVQLTKLESCRRQRAVYNFYIGDGACRLNGGLELLLDLIEKAHEYDDFKPLLNLFVYHNEFWAVEDNLVAKNEEEHKLHNRGFYDLVRAHPMATTCRTEAELAAKLAQLTQKCDRYARSFDGGGGSGGAHGYDAAAWRGEHIELIIVESLKEIPLPPPLFGDLSAVKGSAEMRVFAAALERFSAGCEEKVPIYGCSAFEYIQYLDVFMSDADLAPVSAKYEYCCAKTDIQAAQLSGYTQPEGKCVLMINDVYGINSLGETLRAHMQKTDAGAQVMIWIWHPALQSVMDLFTVHRPQLVWPSVGPNYVKFFVNNAKDLASIELEGDGADTIGEITGALDRGTKLVTVNMVPQHERDAVAIDTHVSMRA